MIPKRIHYVWVGGPVPEKYQTFIDGWRRLHPDWEIVRWDESNIDLTQPLLAEALKNRKWAKVSDIARLTAVHALGGIYLDTDFELLKPLNPLLDNECFLTFQGADKASDLVCNGCFGATPGHWFLTAALETLLQMKTPRFSFDRPTRYGPKLVTRLLRRYGFTDADANHPGGTEIRDIRIYPAPMFFPFPYGGEFTPDCVRPETLAIHHWERSWSASLPLPIRVAQAAKRSVSRTLRRRHV